MTTSNHASRPSVVFLCRSNRGKSRMAGAIAQDLDGERWQVHTAGTHPAPPGDQPNADSVATLTEQGIEIPPQAPRGLDPEELAAADRVVLVGSPTEEQWAALEEAGMSRNDVTVWQTVEPAEDGIEGAERMRLIRDDIADRVWALHGEMIAE